MSLLNSIPVGYRFHPTDQELISHYLKLKNQGHDRLVSNIQEVDVLKREPWDIPVYLRSESKDQEWHFFGRKDSKYGKSTRCNRATKEGFWKPTGKDRFIKDDTKIVIGTKKSLVFHIKKGNQKQPVRTNWVMHELCASADKYNPQAFVVYVLRKKTDDSVEIPNTDGAKLNVSSQHALLPNNVHNCPAEFISAEDDVLNTAVEAFRTNFDWQQPTMETLNMILHPYHSADACLNQEINYMTAQYINVSNNDPGVTQFQNIKRLEELLNNINIVTSLALRTPDNVPFDSESGTETDYDVPQSLVGDEAVHGGSSYLSDTQSSDQKFYNDMILACQVSRSGSSDIIQHVKLKADKEGNKKILPSERVRDSEVSNLRARTYSEVPAQASGKKGHSNLLLWKSEITSLEAAGDDSSVAKSSRNLEVAGKKLSGMLGKSSYNMGLIVYAENPRVSNGTTPPSNYILNIAIGLFLTVVITGEVLFGMVR